MPTNNSTTNNSTNTNSSTTSSTGTGTTGNTGTTNTGTTAGGNVVVNSDNIQGNSEDNTRIENVCSALTQAGYAATNGGIDPDAHSNNAKSMKDTYIVCIVGGACAGTFSDMASSWYQEKLSENNNKAGIAFITPYSREYKTGLHGVTHLERSSDDDFSSSDFQGIDNPIQFLQSAGLGYCESTTEEGFPAAVVEMVSGNAATQTTSGGGGMAYKDATFDDCIRRICASTDSVFIVECNAAFLFPYTDWMNLLNQKNGFKHIYKKDLDPETFEFNYANDGFYNSVTVNYSGGSVTEKYEDLISIYGEINKEYDDEEVDEATARYKANSYLAQYVRMYNNKTRLRALQRFKYLGGNFYIVQNPLTKTNEFYFLKGYTMRTQKDQPMYVDLELGFGPDSPDDIEEPNSPTGSGGTTSGGTKDSICRDCASKVKYSFDYTCDWSDADCVYNEGKTDCYGMSNLLYTKLTAAGIQARIIQYGSSAAPSGTHRSVQTMENGTWTDIDYRSYGFDNNFVNMKTKSGCFVFAGGDGSGC